jgi:hypothetical protein
MTIRSEKSLAEKLALIRSARGMFKLKRGEKSVVQEHLEERRAAHRAEDLELEQRKSQRLASMISNGQRRKQNRIKRTGFPK